MTIIGLIMGGIVAFCGMLFFYGRRQQEKENGKQEETSNQNKTKINSLFLVICIVFLLSLIFGQAFLAGGIAGIVAWVVVNKNRTFLTSFLRKLTIFSAEGDRGIGKPVFEDLFTFSGRRNRKSYILLQLLFILIFVIIFFTIDVIGIEIVSFVILLFTNFCNYVVTAQRFRDIGWSGKSCLLFLPCHIFFLFAPVFASIIVIAGLMGGVALMCIPGKVGENKYGPDPLKNYKGD